MKSCLNKVVLSTFIFFYGPFLWGNQLYTHYLPYFAPYKENNECRDRLQLVAQKFAEHTGTVVISASCEPDTILWTMEGKIIYSAAQRVTMFSLYDEVIPTVEELVSYPNLQACQDSIPTQKEIFISATGLEPLVAYCYSGSSVTNKFHMNIQAAGVSKRHFKMHGGILNGSIVANPEVFFAKLKERVSPLPWIVANLGIYQQSLWNKVGIAAYYENEELFLSNNIELKYDTIDACLADVSRYESNFYNFHPHVLSVFCTRDSGISGVRLNLLSLSKEMWEDAFQHQNLQRFYDQQSTCEQEGQKTSDLLISQGFQVIAMICNLSNRKYELHAFFN